ncbi:MAG TPA: GNAT family N-acetyltransferase [candidate division Zixibacteria bacterium]|nr:GNAT family N-acetyltransferase [candidate division Zixibacteria bacterium]
MIEIKEQENSSINKEELVKFYLKHRSRERGRELSTEEIERITRYIDKFVNTLISKSFLAYKSGKLVGWLGITEVFTPTILFNEFHPIVESNENRKQIALELLQKSFEYAAKKNIGNTRVFNDVTKENEKRFLEIEKYYLEVGMKKTHVVLCMENKITTDDLKGIVIDSEYHIESWKEQTEEALKECYNKIFAESYDNFTNSLDEEERKYWNTITRGNSNDASIVIKKDDELVALILAVDYGDFMELGPIGVVPNHRGKKLGKVLMEECLSNLIKQGKIENYLEVDQTNIPAIKLYESFGFREVSKKHGFLWRNKK